MAREIEIDGFPKPRVTLGMLNQIFSAIFITKTMS